MDVCSGPGSATNNNNRKGVLVQGVKISTKPDEFDCIVIGAGHAGAEAAHAAAKLGAKTLLATMSREAIARMSCNPAIGGLAKGQIAREVDALGGLMGRAIDATGIQFRMLNRSKGPAVQSLRAQADKYEYKNYIRHCLEQTANLTIVETIVADVLSCEGEVSGVRCRDGRVYKAPAVILTTGTFLRGIMHMGAEQWAGGRSGEPASNELSDSLRQLGLTLGRLKTGTPPRLDGSTIDYDKLQIQPGDEEPLPFSFMTEKINTEQIPCWITYTNEKIHELLRDNLDRTPLYTGQIKATGPRYCPSIESKIVRFADKDRHQVFLEPEDRSVSTIYCNGISTSVPKDIQEQMLRLLPGTENAVIVNYAYAIEYDYCPPMQLRPNLESKKIAGLFFAGQINGTSGYEEAAGQGIIAGINAARKLQLKEPIVLGRDQAYIGVLIDDLLTKNITEPYRMFTSRAEYRLSLRSDNADRRMTPVGKQVGLVDNDRWAKYQEKIADLARLTDYLKKTHQNGKSLWHLLKQPDNPLGQDPGRVKDIEKMKLKPEVLTAAAIDAKYEGYLIRQARHVAGFGNLEKIKLPCELDYAQITHLRAEAKEKLSAFQPATLAQAGRIAGISPADITVLQIYMKKRAS
ncbi:MAG: tRNA uridine-5-carboxymethylaminomethyl(34) synthesis enzyme MnmG [Planctomycetota bacterium]